MGERPPAIFVPKSPPSGDCSQCLGIVVPLDIGWSDSDVSTNKPVRGWVNGSLGSPIKWQPVREFGAGIPSRDEQAAYGLAVDLFCLWGGCTRLPTPCYVMPSCDMRPSVVEVTLDLRIRTLFETAGFQRDIWSGMLAEIVYRDFMGTLDRDFIARARERRFRSGDAVLFTIREHQRIAGVALLSSQTEGGNWLASLHCPFNDIPDLTGTTLVSKDVCEFDRVTAVFQNDFALVREVRSR